MNLIKRLENFNIHYKEIVIILSILFFTVLFNYITVSPILTDYIHENRYAQIVSVFVVSLSMILSFKSTFNIKIEHVLNALIVTFIFTFITKPKPKLTEKVKQVVKNVKNEVKNEVKNVKEEVKQDYNNLLHKP